MAQKWVVNESIRATMIGGKLLNPGEGTWVDDGPLTFPPTGVATPTLRFFSADEIASPTAEMVGDRLSTFVDSASPEKRYQSNGSALYLASGSGSGSGPSGGDRTAVTTEADPVNGGKPGVPDGRQGWRPTSMRTAGMQWSADPQASDAVGKSRPL